MEDSVTGQITKFQNMPLNKTTFCYLCMASFQYEIINTCIHGYIFLETHFVSKIHMNIHSQPFKNQNQEKRKKASFCGW